MSVTVDEDLHKIIKRIAKARNKMISHLVDEMLRKELENQEKELEELSSYFKWTRK